MKIFSVSNGVPSLQISGAPGAYELQASFDFCARAIPNLNDSKMGDIVQYFDQPFVRAKVSRARLAIEVVIDLTDHYSQMASYLRLNGILPPSATVQIGRAHV